MFVTAVLGNLKNEVLEKIRDEFQCDNVKILQTDRIQNLDDQFEAAKLFPFADSIVITPQTPPLLAAKAALQKPEDIWFADDHGTIIPLT